MLIILEGNECCYKSTIANKLSEKLNIPVIKGSSFELSQCTNEELFARFKEFAQMDNVIFDRFLYSNLCYAALYDDFAILNEQQVKEIEDMIRHKATLYYLFADDEVIEKRIKQRGDDYVDVNMVSKINKKYLNVIRETKIKTVFYDTNEWSSDDIAEEIVQDFMHNETR